MYDDDRQAKWRVGLYVLAACQICWGLYLCCGSVFGAWFTLFPPEFIKHPNGKPNPALEIMEGTPVLWYWTVAQLAIHLGVAIAYTAAGIALIFRKPWALTTSLACSYASLAVIVLGFVMQMVYMFPVFYPDIQSTNPTARTAAIGGLAGIFGSLCFAPIYPIVALIVLTREPMREIFRISTDPVKTGDGPPVAPA